MIYICIISYCNIKTPIAKKSEEVIEIGVYRQESEIKNNHYQRKQLI